MFKKQKNKVIDWNRVLTYKNLCLFYKNNKKSLTFSPKSGWGKK